MSRLRPADVMVRLRRHGIVVHHAAADVRGPGRVVVFLEATLGQHEQARDVVLQLPGVVRVEFVTDARTIMVVTGAGSG